MTTSKAMIDLLNRPILFGLRQQGWLELVHERRQAGVSWEEIGREIGWTGDAVERFYALETEDDGAGALPGCERRYEHDCDTCRFIGQLGRFDVYLCPQHAVGQATIVARFGDDGPEYFSGQRVQVDGIYLELPA